MKRNQTMGSAINTVFSLCRDVGPGLGWRACTKGFLVMEFISKITKNCLFLRRPISSFWKRINYMTLIKRPEAKRSSTNNCPHSTSSFPIHFPWQGPAHTEGRWMDFVGWPGGQRIKAAEFINVGCTFHHRTPCFDSSLNNLVLF